MKAIVFIISIFLAMVTGCSTTQNATESDFGVMDTYVTSIKTGSYVYKKSMVWVAETYHNPGAVLEYYDESTGVITLNGAFEYHQEYAKFFLHYKLTMTIESNGTARFKMQPLYWIGRTSYGIRKVFTKDMAEYLRIQYSNMKSNYMIYVM